MQTAPSNAPRDEAPRAEGDGAQAAARDGAQDAAKSRPSAWIFSTYFAEGLPYSIVHQISAELFTAMGASLSAIGLTSLYGLAWNFKFAWSPIVGRLGSLRRWIIATEVLLGLFVLAMAWPADRGDLGTTARVLVAIAFLAATQDIAVDGFYLSALEKKDQATWSGMRVGAYRAAMWVGKGGLVVLAGLSSWLWCFVAAGVMLLALAAFHALYLPTLAGPMERVVVEENPYRSPRTAERPAAREGAAKIFAGAFVSFFRQPKIALSLAFILLFRAGDAMMFAMSTPLLKELGLDLAMRGLVSGTLGTVTSIAGSVLGGIVIGKRGLERTLFPIAALQGGAILLYTWMAWAKPGLLLIGAVVVVEQLAAGIGTAAFMVFLMRRCAGEHKAAHFAIASALMSVAATVAGSASGYIADAVGFTAFFTLAFVASWPGIALAWWAPKD